MRGFRFWKVLALLAHDFINRRIFRVEVSDEPFPEDYVQQKIDKQARHFGLSDSDAHYLVAQKAVGKDMYNPLDDRIEILEKDGSIHDVTEVSDMLNIDTLSKHVRKYYLCTQRL